MPRILVAFAILALTLACSSAPQLPVVDSVSFPTFTLDASGNRSAQGTIAAHSPNGSITQLQLHVPPQNGVTLQDGPPLNVASYTSPYGVNLGFPPAVPVGNYTLQVTATDSTGATSAVFTTTVTLQ